MSGQVFGLLPAAGRSRRMGRPKLALPLGGATVLECAAAALRQAGVSESLVVVGPHGDVIASLAEQAGAHVLHLDHETADMRATVAAGLEWLEQRYRPRPGDAWLLLPADHPCLDAAVIRKLLQYRTQHPQFSIFIPTFDGKRGHPPLIDWRDVEALRRFPPDLGLNHFFRAQANAVCELPVRSPGVLQDLDTPEDYQRLLDQ